MLCVFKYLIYHVFIRGYNMILMYAWLRACLCVRCNVPDCISSGSPSFGEEDCTYPDYDPY